MILKFLGGGRSQADNSALGQPALANNNHMQTDMYGKTEWWRGRFPVALNLWRTGSASGLYAQVDAPSATKFRNGLGLDIDNNIPMAADTVEFEGGAHYNGHPSNQRIGHWLVVGGYVNNGDDTKFWDSSTSIWGQAQPTFYHPTNSFVNTYLQNNGIAW